MDLSYENLARKAEKESNWEEAYRCWMCCDRIEDAKACQTIIEANRLGERYRTLIAVRLKETRFSFKEYIQKYGEVGMDKLLREAYDEIYVKPYINQRNG